MKMKLYELIQIMNIADVEVCSNNIPELYPGYHKKVDMFNQEKDPILKKYGDREVEKLTNIAKAGDVIWIK